jgi:cyclopropane fatty-acyl-phospholipid synthase-like methyltransferase
MDAETDPRLDNIGLKYGTDKASKNHNYLNFYERFLAPLRFVSGVRLLELGVFEGASVKMWEEYFPEAKIIGADNDRAKLKYATARIVMEYADQSDVADLIRLSQAHGPFDVVIDDGSHIWDHQIASLRYLYPFVKTGGYYILEDIDTSYGAYAEKFHGVSDVSAAEYLKKLCDYVLSAGAGVENETDPFIRSYARQTEFVAMYRRTAVLRRR